MGFFFPVVPPLSFRISALSVWAEDLSVAQRFTKFASSSGVISCIRLSNKLSKGRSLKEFAEDVEGWGVGRPSVFERSVDGFVGSEGLDEFMEEGGEDFVGLTGQ